MSDQVRKQSMACAAGGAVMIGVGIGVNTWFKGTSGGNTTTPGVMTTGPRSGEICITGGGCTDFDNVTYDETWGLIGKAQTLAAVIAIAIAIYIVLRILYYQHHKLDPKKLVMPIGVAAAIAAVFMFIKPTAVGSLSWGGFVTIGGYAAVALSLVLVSRIPPGMPAHVQQAMQAASLHGQSLQQPVPPPQPIQPVRPAMPMSPAMPPAMPNGIPQVPPTAPIGPSPSQQLMPFYGNPAPTGYTTVPLQPTPPAAPPTIPMQPHNVPANLPPTPQPHNRGTVPPSVPPGGPATIPPEMAMQVPLPQRYAQQGFTPVGYTPTPIPPSRVPGQPPHQADTPKVPSHSPAAPQGNPPCPRCRGPLALVPQTQRWYCSTCQSYV